ncbi:methyltransferase domain-containing protein [Streptomyces sp. NPDC050636]|uniref:methyltransferase domain-containing protein n=1 Tax=Streptomyces sp. NPDC050636 TaxID=3154510 RepID=UPI0034480295
MPGIAVDSACGTGRHSAALTAYGYQTIGVDQSAEILEVARQVARDRIPSRTAGTTASTR